ncbi:MAG: hypothetical protein LUD71_01840 [Clostridiales bacterium]|nr:hypothetical protein [Clostridiales bacterium]
MRGKRKRGFLLIALAFVMSVLLVAAGCGKEKTAETDYYIYYINQDVTGLELMQYEP